MKGIYQIIFENNKIIRNIPHPIIDLYYTGGTLQKIIART